jgi:hypothetical protein
LTNRITNKWKEGCKYYFIDEQKFIKNMFENLIPLLTNLLMYRSLYLFIYFSQSYGCTVQYNIDRLIDCIEIEEVNVENRE